MMSVMHPEEFQDTDPKALEVWFASLRAMDPSDRFLAPLQMSHFALNMSEAGVRDRYPNASEDEVRLRTAALHLPRELMIAAYGWDPEEHG